MWGKYGDIRDFDLGKTFRAASYTWYSLLEGYKFPKKGLSWDVEDGNFVRFWLDDWICEGIYPYFP